MARTNKWTIRESKADSRYFTHTGHFGTSPNSMKKQGSGRGNWGKAGDEIEDLIDMGEIKPVFNKQRRGSNSQARETVITQVQETHV